LAAARPLWRGRHYGLATPAASASRDDASETFAEERRFHLRSDAMPQPDIRRYLKHGTLPQLRAFEASARLGSFTRAAEELHMAQATASVQIKKLSETVGLALFEQEGKTIRLTEAGRRLFAGCGEVFRALSGMEQALTELRGVASGRLRLAVPATARHFAARLLGAYVQRNPGIQASLQVHERTA
jgi:hypothetical protein